MKALSNRIYSRIDDRLFYRIRSRIDKRIYYRTYNSIRIGYRIGYSIWRLP